MRPRPAAAAARPIVWVCTRLAVWFSSAFRHKTDMRLCSSTTTQQGAASHRGWPPSRRSRQHVRAQPPPPRAQAATAASPARLPQRGGLTLAVIALARLTAFIPLPGARAWAAFACTHVAAQLVSPRCPQARRRGSTARRWPPPPLAARRRRPWWRVAWGRAAWSRWGAARDHGVRAGRSLRRPPLTRLPVPHARSLGPLMSAHFAVALLQLVPEFRRHVSRLRDAGRHGRQAREGGGCRPAGAGSAASLGSLLTPAHPAPQGAAGVVRQRLVLAVGGTRGARTALAKVPATDPPARVQ